MNHTVPSGGLQHFLLARATPIAGAVFAAPVAWDQS